MRFPIFSHTANPAVDTPLFRKSLSYCDGLVERDEGYWLPDRGGIHLFPPSLRPEEKPDDDSNLKSIDSRATITGAESQRNAEYDKHSRNNPASVVRAHQKIKMWPAVFDSKAVRVGPRV